MKDSERPDKHTHTHTHTHNKGKDEKPREEGQRGPIPVGHIPLGTRSCYHLPRQQMDDSHGNGIDINLLVAQIHKPSVASHKSGDSMG